MPTRHSLKMAFSVLILPSLFLWAQSGIAMADSAPHMPWRILETAHTLINYQEPNDLTKFNARIKFAGKNWGLTRLFRGGEARDLESVVKKKVDMVFVRAQQILGMRRPMKKVHIHMYQDSKQLHQAYERIYGGRCRIRAWYRYRNNTVYVNIRDLNEGMLAHELAHAIIDNYLDVRPPRATAEILARYVDSHLR